MIDFEDALKLILSESQPLATKEVPISESIARVIAEKVTAPIDLPPFTKATVDGFALFSEDVKDKKTILEVIGSICCGILPKEKLERGQAMQIQAEAALPTGSDTVVPMDEVRLLMNGTRVGMLKRIKKNENVIIAGGLLKKGDEIMKAGTCLNARDIGLISSVGIEKISVFPPPRVGILTIGNEFINVGNKIKPGQVRDSNGIQLLTALYEMRVQPEYFGTVAENEKKIIQVINQAKLCNVLILNGISGISRRKLLMDVFKKEGVELLFEGIYLKPCGALTLAKYGQTLIFILHQNPFFSMILFEALITPALRKMMGYNKLYNSVIDAVLEKTIKKSTDHHLIKPANIFYHNNKIFVRPHSLDENDIFSYAKCNVLISVPKNVKRIKSGKTLEIISLRNSCNFLGK